MTLNFLIGLSAIVCPLILAVFTKPILFMGSSNYRKLGEANSLLDEESFLPKSLVMYCNRYGEIDVNRLSNLNIDHLITQRNPRKIAGTLADLMAVSHFARARIRHQLRTLEHAAFFVFVVSCGAFLVFILGSHSAEIFGDIGGVLRLNRLGDLLDAFGGWLVKHHLLPMGELISILFIILVLKSELTGVDELIEKVDFRSL